MKNLMNLGKILNKKEQKLINGGKEINKPQCHCTFSNGGTMSITVSDCSDCSNVCSHATSFWCIT